MKRKTNEIAGNLLIIAAGYNLEGLFLSFSHFLQIRCGLDPVVSEPLFAVLEEILVDGKLAFADCNDGMPRRGETRKYNTIMGLSSSRTG